MNFTMPVLDSSFYLAAAPIIILCLASIKVMLLSVSKKFSSTFYISYTLITSLVLAILFLFISSNTGKELFLGGALITDSLAFIGQLMILVIALVVSLFFKESYFGDHFLRGDIVALFLMSVTGMLVLVTSNDLITLFIGLELASISIYAIIGYSDQTARRQEGAIKYFILGSVAAAILLFGFALLFASANTLNIKEIVTALPELVNNGWARLGAVFVLAGLAFKLALVPFHLWSPDVYESAPTGYTAFMATAFKVALVIFAARFFYTGLSIFSATWLPALTFLAALSLIVGNVFALVQSSVKRMLAYSSISHSGYMAIALCAMSVSGSNLPLASILYYLIGYSIVSLGVFGILMILENNQNEQIHLDDLAGLAKTHPWLSVALTIFMFAFAGLPPTVGFTAKFFVFTAALQSNLVGLVLVGVLGSVISLYYYLRVVVTIFMKEPEKNIAPLQMCDTASFSKIFIAASVVISLLLGTIYAGTLIEALQSLNY